MAFIPAYRIQIKIGNHHWRIPRPSVGSKWDSGGECDVIRIFHDALSADAFAHDYVASLRASGVNVSYRITRIDGYYTENTVVNTTNNDAGGTRMGALQHVKPLNLDKGQLLAKIQENLAAQKKARDDAAAAESAAQKGVTDFVTAHAEEIGNYLKANFGGSWSAVLERVTEAFEDGNYKTPSSVPGRLESELEKYARVLAMSADTQVEVFPGADVYNLI